MPHFAAVFFLLLLSVAAGAATLADKFSPGTPYYFDSFDSRQKPWNPGQHLNIEEVFKNYQYYEIVLGQDSKEITVSQYVRGVKTSSEVYLELPDGSLRKKENVAQPR
ncbi:MAG: hypothetical protein OEV23_06485 [Gallionella sp.]|nr:hypothetical protein [Gallionella sp.]